MLHRIIYVMSSVSIRGDKLLKVTKHSHWICGC